MPDSARLSIRIALLAALGLARPASAADAAPQICAAPQHREFDFWAGEWQVRDATGAMAGESSITVEQSGCVLVEHWRSAKGGTGESFNYYDPATKLWKQRWVGLGLILEMQGGLSEGSMVLEGPLHNVKQQRTSLLRGTWTLLPDGRVRQHFVESVDDGKTWKDWFDGYYTRKDAATK